MLATGKYQRWAILNIFTALQMQHLFITPHYENIGGEKTSLLIDDNGITSPCKIDTGYEIIAHLTLIGQVVISL